MELKRHSTDPTPRAELRTEHASLGHASPTEPLAESGRLSSEEFAQRFQASFRVLWLVAAGISGDQALADDIVQDAAIVAMRKLNEFRRGTNFNAWMAQTVRFVAYNSVRKECRHRAPSLDFDACENKKPSPRLPDDSEISLAARGELSVDQAHFDDQVVRALSALSATARSCLLLRTLGDLDYSELSTTLDIPAGTAMSHVHRACRTLRMELGPHDV